MIDWKKYDKVIARNHVLWHEMCRRAKEYRKSLLLNKEKAIGREFIVSQEEYDVLTEIHPGPHHIYGLIAKVAA